jgi:hypothetical protein
MARSSGPRDRSNRNVRSLLLEERLREHPRERLMLSAVEPFHAEDDAVLALGGLIHICTE